jgi:hypothetical protein
MKKPFKIAIGAAVLCGVAALSVWAYSVSYITYASTFSPTHVINFTGPPGSTSGDNVTVGDAANGDPICPGSTITFDATFGVGGNEGNTTFPRTVNFTASDAVGNPVTLLPVTGMPVSHTFCLTAACITANPGAASSFTDTITVTAPATLGAPIN